jgi:nicotinate-nucleotide pyrophosphorylase (carboxylating)
VTLDAATLRQSVQVALQEDLGAGDITSQAVVDEAALAAGSIVAREPLVLCGLDVAREVFLQAGAGIRFEANADDGTSCEEGAVLATLRGPARAILAGERTALNFLQRMSGIATATRRLLHRVEGSRLQISDTRKTVPGLRAFDKYAVATGGGTNHRAGLYDAYLIKDNHWRLAGGVGAALRRARAALGGRKAPGIGLEIEVTSLEEVREALEAGADALLLDNMDDETLQRAVALTRGLAFLEVSGRIGDDRLPRLATLGVQRVSIGALTHSVRAVDLALELEAA